MVNGVPPEKEPVAAASQRIRTTAVVAFFVALAFVSLAVFLDTIITHRGPVIPIAKVVIMAIFITALVYAAYRIAIAAVVRVADAEEAKLATERELKELRENEHVLLNAPVASAVLLTPDGTVLAVNDTGAKILGSTPAELVGRSMRDVLPPEVAAQREQLGSQVEQLDGPLVVTDEFLGRHYVQHVVPVKDEGGSIARVAVFGVDITEQVETNRKLKDSEEKYRTQFETSVDGIVFSSLEGTILDCNPAYAEMLGYEVGELIGTNAWDLTPREWQAVDWDVIQNQVLPSGRSDKYEKEYVRKDGSRVPVTLRVWSVVDSEGHLSAVWGRVEDLSKQKQYEDFIRQTIIRLEQANERLREVDRLKTEFVGMVSHELRAPIAAMESGFMALRALGDSVSEDQRRDLLEVIERGTVRLRHLVDDLLDITRIESGALRLELERVDAEELAQRVIDLYVNRFEEKGIELCLEDTDGSRLLVCDPRRIEQVLTNLLDNALKFTQEGSVKVRLDSTPSVMIFAVTDSGPGLEPELHEQVFEKFFTADAPGGQQGVGLGLAISKGIVEAHQGRMWVESHQGSGATFGFELPLP